MSVTTQLETMLAMIGMGGWLGLSIDTYSRFLQRRKRARFIVFINDVLFWLLQGLIIFYVLLLVNEGELRVYIFFSYFMWLCRLSKLVAQPIFATIRNVNPLFYSIVPLFCQDMLLYSGSPYTRASASITAAFACDMEIDSFDM